MTEQVLAENSQNQVNTASAPAITPNVTHETSSEKMLSQKEVNEIVGRAKSEAEQRAYERAKRELSMPARSAEQPSQPVQSVGGMQQQSPADIAASQFVNQFIQKMEPGKAKYSDFEQKVAKLNIPNIPEIIHLATQTENTHDVMYDLANNPHNLIKLRQLYQINPQLAMDEIHNLSASIKQNEAAQQAKTANEPLGQVKPSTTGTDNGSLSVRDYKKADWLRA
jgi:hypothetical protein